MSGHLFDIEDYPEVPLFREPRRRKGAQIEDERLDHDYPPEWKCCSACDGSGFRFEPGEFQFAVGYDVDDPKLVKVVLTHEPSGEWTYGVGRSEIAAKSHIRIAMFLRRLAPCPECKGMGSVKGRVRLEAGHRCVRCGHPYIPKGDARMLGVEPTPHHWSPCDERCSHEGPVRIWLAHGDWKEIDPWTSVGQHVKNGDRFEAEWRILTVHHLDGDKANLRWWNLASLCQRCHLYIQAKVVLERVYPHEHSEWFKPYAAGWYAFSYLGEDLSREEVEGRLDELLGLELAVAPHTL